MVLRPFAMVVSGQLEVGLELVIGEGKIQEIRPHTGMPDPILLSVPFVNAHSHLEYYGLLGKIQASEYWPWIRAITQLKLTQSEGEVESDCELAALSNVESGVGLIGEHTDRMGARRAIDNAGMRSIVFQELITFFEQANPAIKIDAAKKRFAENRADGWAPHATYTVDRTTLEWAKNQNLPKSIHAAETEAENEFFSSGTGPIAEFYRSNGFEPSICGMTAIGYLDSIRMLDISTQLVHCCAATDADIELIRSTGTAVAHCPRSNMALSCPNAPIRRMLANGIRVGLGMDSAASSGPIDMFAEMRAALYVSRERHEPITAEQVWNMATTMGAASLGVSGWDIELGFSGKLISLPTEGVGDLEEAIERMTPKEVQWIDLSTATD